jgi:hypothetical protein
MAYDEDEDDETETVPWTEDEEDACPTGVAS